MQEPILPSASRIWIFQCNPQKYRIKDALADEAFNRCFHWQVKQYKKEIAKGNLGILWCSGPSAGIYGITELISDPGYFVEPDYETKYYIDSTGELGSQFRVKMKVLKSLIKVPVPRDLIKITDGLQRLSIIRMPKGTNFPVTADEWRIIEKLIGK